MCRATIDRTGTKKCTGCGKYKPFSAYGKGGRGKIMARCKDCIRHAVQSRNAKKIERNKDITIHIDDHLYDVFMGMMLQHATPTTIEI